MPLVAPPPLETPRFVVRPLVADDLAGLMAVNGDEAVTRHLPYATWKSMDDARAWLSRMEGIQATGTAIQFVIADRAAGRRRGVSSASLRPLPPGLASTTRSSPAAGSIVTWMSLP